MTDPRLSTVFDYANLRLHTDGTRVYQKSSNLRPHLVRTVVQDSRSNWIAKDAGGSGKVRTHRKIRKEPVENEETEEQGAASANEGQPEEEEEEEEEEDESEASGKKRKSKLKSHQIRMAKRQKYINDFDYLAPYTPPSSAASVSTSGLPEPSADLLNVIHRFASEFYHERGQLLNISRQYRREKKERTLRRLGLSNFDNHDTPGSDSDSGSGSDSDSEGSSSESSSEQTEGDDEDEEQEGDKDGTSSDSGDIEPPIKAKSRDIKGKGKESASRKGSKYKRDDNLYIDMYKMFDGSAMMALGMLVQEQIAQMLNPTMPEAWKEEMQKVYQNDTVNPGSQNDSLSEELDVDAATAALPSRSSSSANIHQSADVLENEGETRESP